MQGNSVLSPSPSFNSYSSGKLHGIATRVVEEPRHVHDSDADHIFACAPENPHLQFQETSKTGPLQQQKQQQEGRDNNDGEGEDDFEFAFVCREPYSSPISADEIFYNGRIRPVHPISIFDQSLVVNYSLTKRTDSSKKSRLRRPPLRKLMTEEREREAASCSTSEADELDGVPTGTYCVWTPKKGQAKAEAAPSSHDGCKKSNSSGSSKRWKLRDYLHRSNSDGNETFVVLTPSKKTITDDSPAPENGNKGKVRDADYARNRAVKEAGDKRRSSFLVGFFANVDGLSWRLQFAATER
ncbi:uncharacterized protein LOC122289022 [Carya illinoinensis]|uniref:Uncharacterized protein n=1 Tax=Carya illinoinensis TaxID=32201 RepID=A0A8T1NTY5_CARIL|nr:uncharacterized protein LOC122289022 [Carya illinoinensis]KAG6633111.1 hypothetical protein CIPAW_12G026500 [Carya illinoinensis]